MKRFFLSLLLCVSAGMAVSAASMSAAPDGDEDDGATFHVGRMIDFESLDSMASKKPVRIDDIVVIVESKTRPTGIGGSVGEGPRLPTDIWPWNSSHAPEVTPANNDATGGNSVADAVAGGIVNNSAATVHGSFDATGTGMAAQSGPDANLGEVSTTPQIFIEPGLPVLPDGVGGHVASDGGGPKPTLPTKPAKPSGSRKYSNGSVTVVVDGGDQGCNPSGSGNVAKAHHFDIEPGLPSLPDGVGGSVVSDNPKPIKPGTTRPSRSTGNTLPDVRPGNNNGGSGSGSQGSDALVPYIPEGEYAPSVNGVNINNLIPLGSKKDLGLAASLIDMILEADPDLDFSEVAALVDELMAH